MVNNSGLTEIEVTKNREKYGTNDIGNYKKNSFISLVIQSLGDPIIRILLMALAIKTIFLIKSFDWYETIGIVLAIFMASFISSISEYGSDKAFASLMSEAAKLKCRVKRNGKTIEIPITEVVVNDLIMLESGEKVPADGKIISGNISVDESNLNGESKEVKKSPSTILLRGSVVVFGEAIMKVDKVGVDTFYGKMASELKIEQSASPLKLRLAGLARLVSKIGYVSAFIIFVSYMFFNGLTLTNIIYALTLSVTIIIVCVPEGLPMMVTLVLSSNMKRMLKDNVLVRKLVGIETAGSLNILFTDKTGTLTKGELEVVAYVSGNLKEYSYQDLVKTKLSKIVKISCTVNNASSFFENRIIGGNITDKAILKFIKNNNINYYKENVIPFDSKNKYSITTIEDKERINIIKGAPEILLSNCKYYYNELGKKERLNQSNIKKYIENKAKEGIRIILLATSTQKEPTHFENLTLVGLLLIKDEIRPNVKEGIELVKSAHINIVMLTGDNRDTALSIGKELGLYQEGDIALTSTELNKLSDVELKGLLPRLKIIARMLPHDKSRLIRVCQELDLVVGMTGDGVNDAPALKRSDVGFSMGSGTEVAKEASDIVIMDNDFMSISKAILYGRTVFKSIRKFIILQLTINLCALSLSIVGPFIGINTPVTVVQMLWINMVMDTLAGLAFAFEPPLLEYMKEKPKDKNEPIMNGYMYSQILWTGLLSSLLCFFFLKSDFINSFYSTDIELLSAFFGLFIFIDIFNSFNARTHRLNILANITKNKVFIIIMTFIIIIQILLIYFGGTAFRTTSLTFKELEIMIMFAFLVIPIDWLRKLYLKKKNINIGV
jgi:plasma-membrane calcium-translocating P-type ATPase